YFDHYLTVKYSSTGATLWTRRYITAAHEEFGQAVVVDASGNVFVTGISEGYATIGYSSSGLPLWTNRYSGPVVSYGGGAAIAVDRGGNVFVTGYSSSETNSNYN